MAKFKSILLVPVVLVVICACKPPLNEAPGEREYKLDVGYTPPKVNLEYAANFKVSYKGNAKLVEVLVPYKGAEKSQKYLLVQKGVEELTVDPSVKIIRVPLESIVCTSTTHLPALEMLGVEDKLVGFPSLKYISSPKVRQRIDSGLVQDLGVDKDMNMELLTTLQPEMVMGYTINGDYSRFEPIERLGIPAVLGAGYMEDSPLGRAEWIKFVSLFFNKEQEADSVFNEIKNKYMEVKKLVGNLEVKPTVLSGFVYKDVWYMPGGDSWAGKYLKDAGANFLWSSTKESGSIELSFEAVYGQASDADFWIGASDYNDLRELKQKDARFAGFAAFKNKNVYTQAARVNSNGGNEYFETGAARPDIVLSDLVKILHPELLPDYELYYHKRLY